MIYTVKTLLIGFSCCFLPAILQIWTCGESDVLFSVHGDICCRQSIFVVVWDVVSIHCPDRPQLLRAKQSACLSLPHDQDSGQAHGQLSEFQPFAYSNVDAFSLINASTLYVRQLRPAKHFLLLHVLPADSLLTPQTFITVLLVLIVLLCFLHTFQICRQEFF